MFCQFLLYSKATQSYVHVHSFIYIFIYTMIYIYVCVHIYVCMYTHTHMHSFSQIILHHVPSQVTRYNSLCFTVGSHCKEINDSLTVSQMSYLTTCSRASKRIVTSPLSAEVFKLEETMFTNTPLHTHKTLGSSYYHNLILS